VSSCQNCRTIAFVVKSMNFIGRLYISIHHLKLDSHHFIWLLLTDSSRFRFQVSLRVTHLFELGTRDFPLFLRGINKVILNLILLHIGCSHFGIWHVLIFLQPFDDDLACLARRIMSVGRTTWFTNGLYVFLAFLSWAERHYQLGILAIRAAHVLHDKSM
jgi:hypothetical protein